LKIIVHTLDLLSDSEVSEEFDCDVEVEEEEEECLHEKQNNMLKFKCENIFITNRKYSLYKLYTQWFTHEKDHST